jgi:uncharacterized protein involved in exopolysaccharide biosynthesis
VLRESTPGREPHDPLVQRAAEDTSLLGFVNVLLKHRRLIAGCALLATLIFVASALSESRTYTTRVLFTARGARAGALAGIAAQYGLTIVGADPSQSIEFYEELLRSSEVLRGVANQQYEVRKGKRVIRGTLPVIYGIHAGSREAEIDLAAVQLRDHVASSSTRRTGVVTYFVSSSYPELTQQLARNIVTQLDYYNTTRRRSQVTAERSFIEERLADSKAALARAEDRVRSFRDANREYGRAPNLVLENARLNRDVNLRQELVTGLSQAYEQARIEEVRDMPAITVFEPPDLPTSPDATYGLRNTLFAAIGGILVGIILAFIRERFYETKAEGSRTFADFATLKSETLRDIGRPWQPIERLFRAHSGP